MPKQNSICIIIPCYNEERRLTRAHLDYDNNVIFVFVNDGSTDNTLATLESLKRKNDIVIDLKRNHGKGEAIRLGMLHASQCNFFSELDWIGFWDADFSTPIKEIQHFIEFAMFYEDVVSIWGSRIYRLGSTIKRTAKRHYLGRLFATIASLLVKIDSYDSQCGAKLFKTFLVKKIFSEPFISKWIFDIEIYFRITEGRIIEYPVQNWHEVNGGSLKVMRVFFNVFYDLIKIRARYQRKHT